MKLRISQNKFLRIVCLISYNSFCIRFLVRVYKILILHWQCLPNYSSQIFSSVNCNVESYPNAIFIVIVSTLARMISPGTLSTLATGFTRRSTIEKFPCYKHAKLSLLFPYSCSVVIQNLTQNFVRSLHSTYKLNFFCISHCCSEPHPGTARQLWLCLCPSWYEGRLVCIMCRASWCTMCNK